MSEYRLEAVKGVDLEVAEHRTFLESRQEGLGDQLLDDIRATFARLKQNPLVFQKRYAEFRVALTRHLNYKIIYRITSESTVLVVAVRHPAQHPTSWMERL
jgi:plasmid stabilization system protein ParE